MIKTKCMGNNSIKIQSGIVKVKVRDQTVIYKITKKYDDDDGDDYDNYVYDY